MDGQVDGKLSTESRAFDPSVYNYYRFSGVPGIDTCNGGDSPFPSTALGSVIKVVRPRSYVDKLMPVFLGNSTGFFKSVISPLYFSLSTLTLIQYTNNSKWM